MDPVESYCNRGVAGEEWNQQSQQGSAALCVCVYLTVCVSGAPAVVC